MDDAFEKQKHTAFLQNRESLEMSGITEVGAFNDEEIDAVCDRGAILIKGNNLNIETLDLETGTLKVSGTVTALVYSEQSRAGGFLKRLFSS